MEWFTFWEKTTHGIRLEASIDSESLPRYINFKSVVDYSKTKFLKSSYNFFRETMQESAQRAKRLAIAEQIATDREYEFRWEPDDDPDLGDHEMWCPQARNGTCRGHEVLGLAVFSERRVLASLWGIIEPDRNYSRYVEAELAQEAIEADRDSENAQYPIDRWMTNPQPVGWGPDREPVELTKREVDELRVALDHFLETGKEL